jgi:pimeloyl-ACP methyl ester carboxylesterase
MAPSSLILLPGLHGTADLFLPLLNVIPPDLPTRIISYPTSECLSYDDLFRLIDAQLSNEKSIILIAESFSGPLALRYAAMHPARVRAVILCASFIRSPIPRWLRFCAPSFFFRLPTPTFALRHFLLGRSASPALMHAVKQAIGTIHPRVMSRRLKEVFNLDCSPALKASSCPLLYLAAAHDNLVRSSSVNALRAARPDAQILTLPGPHLLLQAEPTAAWRAIQHFLKCIDEARYS